MFKKNKKLIISRYYMEALNKSKCVRCGKPNKNGGKGGRCTSCLKKLASSKKKPGHWQRAQTKADDALRRQDGKNGTASKKSSGRGSRKEIVKQHQSAEKRTGEKLSPDRKDNNKGYASKNVRSIPEKLNRGRHKADEKKLAEWRKSVKKALINVENTLYKGAKDLEDTPTPTLTEVPNTPEVQPQSTDASVPPSNTEGVTQAGKAAGFSGSVTPSEKTPKSLSPNNQALVDSITTENPTKAKTEQNKVEEESKKISAGKTKNLLMRADEIKNKMQTAAKNGQYDVAHKLQQELTAVTDSDAYKELDLTNKQEKQTQAVVAGQVNPSAQNRKGGAPKVKGQPGYETEKQKAENIIARTSADTLTGENFTKPEQIDRVQEATAGGAVDDFGEQVLGQINEKDNAAQAKRDATKTMFDKTGEPGTPNQDILNAITSGNVKVGKQLSNMNNFLAAYDDIAKDNVAQVLKEMGLKSSNMADMSDREKTEYAKKRTLLDRKAYANTLETEYNKAVDAKKTPEQKQFEQDTGDFNARSAEFNPDSVIENGLNISNKDNPSLFAAVQTLRGRDPNGISNRSAKPFTAEDKFEAIKNVKKELVNHFGNLGASFDNVKMSPQELNDTYTCLLYTSQSPRD